MRRLLELLRRPAVLFLLVGGFNTAVGLGTFAILYALAGDVLHYLGALVIAYAIGTVIGFVLHRRLVFDVRGQLARDFVRYVGVQVAALGLNSVLLPTLVEGLGVPVLLAQVLALGIVVVVSFFGHKLISFRRPRAPGAEPEADGEGDGPPPRPTSRTGGRAGPEGGRRGVRAP